MSKFRCKIGLHRWGRIIPYSAYNTYNTINANLPVQVCDDCPAIRKPKS